MTMSKDAKACPEGESPMEALNPAHGNATAAPAWHSQQIEVPRPWSGIGKAYRGLSAVTPKGQGAGKATASHSESNVSESFTLHRWLQADDAEELFHAIKSVSTQF
ncbi:hypothetical protein FVER53590_25533 [Fusarium verticillioides]|nr:hypothetical protein FVER53590_25533 [Fusarium verticillioides]